VSTPDTRIIKAAGATIALAALLSLLPPSGTAAYAASISGRVRLTGPIPTPPKITMTADPVCDRASPNGRPAETIVADSSGNLANVFVYVTSGLPKKLVIPPPPAGEVHIDQKACVFVPHAVGVRVGQEVAIGNSDPTMHNVAGRSVTNPPFNEATPGAGQMLRKTFQRPEVAVKLKCDIHPWMAAYVGVFDHPYFAVSAADGSFTIEGLPESEYTIEAWHESLGSQTAKVEIEDDEQAATLDFSFAGN
jgi:plastocyanin